MKSIHTLIPDIYTLLGRKDGWFTEDLAKEFGIDLGKTLQAHLSEERGAPTLRLSKMGPHCPCALWNSVHNYKNDEKLPPWATFKYAYGHMIEALVIALAKAAGHEVTGEQDVVYVDGIAGHRDAVIDGCIVDVKSTVSFFFQKFKDRSIAFHDTFGYLDQLDGYLVGSLNDPLVRVKDKAYDLAVDKTLGKMVLYEHHIRESHIRQRTATYKQIIALPTAPKCTCGTTEDGKSGNIKLDTRASYSAQKFSCFPNLRTFLYSDGPRYLTKVVRKPDVIEIDRYGKTVYN